MSVVRWNPKELDRLFGFEPLFDRVFDVGPSFFAPTVRGNWVPALDLVDRKDSVVATLEVPGVDPKSIDIQVHGDTLTIRGERKESKEEKEGTYLRREQAIGAFERTVQLPYRVTAEKVTARYSNGLMTITMPKAAEHIARQIPVEVK